MPLAQWSPWSPLNLSWDLQPSWLAALQRCQPCLGPGEPLPAVAASTERLPSSCVALQGSSGSGASSLGTLLASLPAAAALLQGSSSVLTCQGGLCLPCRG